MTLSLNELYSLLGLCIWQFAAFLGELQCDLICFDISRENIECSSKSWKGPERAGF